MIGLEKEALTTHHKLNELYLDLEIRLALEDNFTFLEEIEFSIKKVLNKDLTSLYKKVLKRLSNKDGVVELNPKNNGKLEELYKAIDFIYKYEYLRFNYKWEAKANSTQGDIPFLLANRQRGILEKLKEEKNFIMSAMSNSTNIEDFIKTINIKNTNINLNKVF